MLSAIIRALAVLVIFVSLTEAEAEASGRRVALVIGNSDYVSVPRLDNPNNDATGVAQKLRELGFEVTLLLDLDKAGFERSVREFSNSLDGAEAAVFYYAGHGLEVDDRNYLVPVDANVANEADLPFQLVAVDIALQRLAGQRITSIVILDACRNNPLSDRLAKALGERADAVGKGLASINASPGTLISFSTNPGSVALDGEGKNSPFTEALLHHINAPNTAVVSMMQDVRREVFTRTNKKQLPWDKSSLFEDFFFNKESPKPVKKEQVAKQEDEEPPVKHDPEPVPRDEVVEKKEQVAKQEDEEPPAKREEVKHEPLPKPDGDAHKDKSEPRTDEPDLSHVLPPDLSHVLPPDDEPVPPDDEPVLTGKPPVIACDVIAASPTDPERVSPGTVIGSLDGEAGVKFCRAALAKYPNTPRFEFQLARSLHKIKSYDEVAKLYASLVKRGYFAALVNYGWLLNNGQGVQRNQEAAVRLYLLAASQGDLFGMFNVAMAYDSGEGLPFNPAQAAHWIYAALMLGHDYSIKQMSGPAEGWTKDFRVELQRLLKQAGLYGGRLDGEFGPQVWSAVRELQALPFAPSPGGAVPAKRWDPTSIPINAPMPR